MLDETQQFYIDAAQRLQRLNDLVIRRLDENVFNAKFNEENTDISHGHSIFTKYIDKIIINGCGGTGGWFIPKLVKILNDAKSKGKLSDDLTVYLIDGGTVESKNIIRQNFINRDIGKNKAYVMCARYAPLLSAGINMVYVDKYLAHKDMINILSPDVAKGFIDPLAVDCFQCLDTRGVSPGIFAFNFVDNAVSRKVIHYAISKASRNAHCLDVGNNLYNGQAVYSYYGMNDFASSNYYYNFPEELNDNEFIKLDNCADADLAQNNPEQLFMANDMAATISANILTTLFSDEKIYSGIVEFTTGPKASILNKMPLAHMTGVGLRHISKSYMPNSYPCLANDAPLDLDALFISIGQYYLRNNNCYIPQHTLSSFLKSMVSDLESFMALTSVLDNQRNPYFPSREFSFNIHKYIQKDIDAVENDLKSKKINEDNSKQSANQFTLAA